MGHPDALRHRASRGFVHLHFQPVLPRSARGNRRNAAFVDGAGNVVHLLPHHARQRHACRHHGDGVLAGTGSTRTPSTASCSRIPTDMLLAKPLSTLQNNISANLKIMNVRIQRLYVDAGVVLTILPLLILYLLLQRRFIEGVERSGIVG